MRTPPPEPGRCSRRVFPLYSARVPSAGESMVRRAFTAIALALLSASAFAQSYPNKPIRLVVGFTPGGVSDVLARAMSARLSQNIGHHVVVDNRSGAGTTIASEFIAKSP